jgi:hypothetical protein
MGFWLRDRHSHQGKVFDIIVLDCLHFGRDSLISADKAVTTVGHGYWGFRFEIDDTPK